MARAEKALYARLSGHAGVSALVALRIYPAPAPQGTDYPLVTYQRFGGTRYSAHGDDTGLATALFQITSWDGEYDDAADLSTQVRLALQRYSGSEGSVTVQASFIENENHLFDDETRNHGVALDVKISYVEGVT